MVYKKHRDIETRPHLGKGFLSYYSNISQKRLVVSYKSVYYKPDCVYRQPLHFLGSVTHILRSLLTELPSGDGL